MLAIKTANYMKGQAKASSLEIDNVISSHKTSPQTVFAFLLAVLLASTSPASSASQQLTLEQLKNFGDPIAACEEGFSNSYSGNCKDLYKRCLADAALGDSNAQFLTATLIAPFKLSVPIGGTGYQRYIRYDSNPYCPPSNAAESIKWLRLAADKDNCLATYALYAAHRYPLKLPLKQSSIRAQQLLKNSEDANCSWVQLVRLTEQLNAGDPSALKKIEDAARHGNCHAQHLASDAYLYRQKHLPESLLNPAKGYFWALVAEGNESDQPHHNERGKLQECSKSVRRHRGRVSPPKSISKQLAQEVELAYFNWEVGMDLQTFTTPSETASQAIPKTRPGHKPSTQSEAVPSERTIESLSKTESKRAAGDGPLPASTIFEKLDQSVITIYGAESMAKYLKRKGVLQGSAVAITQNQVATNCHIFIGKDLILLQTRKGFALGTIAYQDEHSDVCVVEAEAGVVLKPVEVITPDQLPSIGDTVYSIGSPSGLTNSLGSGLVSAWRNKDGVKLIQTTSPISTGSSGGGLFDAQGRLVGITSLQAPVGAGLNFAISIDEFPTQ